MVRVVKLGLKRPVVRELLPDPKPREVKYTFISVDDHLMEPPHTFEGRLPRRLQDQAPQVVETEEGHQVWMFEDQPYFQVGFMCHRSVTDRKGSLPTPQATEAPTRAGA